MGFHYEFYENCPFYAAVIFTALCILANYCSEKEMKTSFMQSAKLQTMSNDLINLLDSLPEGIVIYNSETNKVMLANSEFKRLFNIQKDNEDCRG